jgi:RNA polymerase sigma-70 factor (ECF subfamily)
MGGMGASERDFADWYRDEHRKVVGSMLLLCGDPDLADEVTDEAFARALSRWSRVSRMASPGGWTYRVTLNHLRRTMRRRSMDEKRMDAVVQTVPAVGEHAEVWAAVADLPDRQREAVVLRYVADLPEADVATAMKVSRGTVASTTSEIEGKRAGFEIPIKLGHHRGDVRVVQTLQRLWPKR